MVYLLWIVLCCGLLCMIRLGLDVRADYLRREKEEELLEKLQLRQLERLGAPPERIETERFPDATTLDA